MTRPLGIDLYSDIICPWCALGNFRLDKVLAERFPGVATDIRHHPVLLMPDTPPEGLDLVAVMTQRFGKFDPAALFARPEAEARSSGLMLDPSRQPRIANTVPAHTLIRNARPFGTEHRLAVAIGLAHFIDLKDVGDPGVLADIATDHGFDRAEALAIARSEEELAKTRAEAAASSAQGIRGVPHFIFGQGISISGGQSEDALAQAIETALDAEAEPAR